MNTVHRTHGYVLILTLMIISLSVILVTYIANKGSTYIPFARLAIDREKAALLAFSGIQIAMSQLGKQPEKKAEETPAPTQPGQPQQKQMASAPGDEKSLKTFLTDFFPLKNRWQDFTLNKKNDGVDGRIQFCITSEQGKIDINAIYDFKKQKFLGEGQPQGDYKKLLQELFVRIEKLVQAKELFKGFEKFLKDRQYRVNDVTELLTIKEFEPFKRSIVVEPVSAEKKSREKKEQLTIYLTDIFTTFSGKPQIDPWLLTDSVAAILELKRKESGEKEDKESMNELLKKFKRTMNWATDWNTLFSKLYGKEFSALPAGIEALLNPTFDPKMFYIISYGTVGKITQKMVAILERTESSQDDEIVVHVALKKLYWL